MPISWPDAVRTPATAPNKLLPAVQKQSDAGATKGFEYGGLKDGFEIEDRKLATAPKK